MPSNSEKKKYKKINLLKALLLSKIDWEKVKKQGDRFQEDYKKYGAGMLLWAKEEYPDYMAFISIFIGPLFSQLSSTFLPGMKKVVEEYFAFHEEVRTKNPKLYKEELEESNEIFFKKTIQPMDLLVAKDPYIKKINQKMIGNLNILKPQIQDYSERLRPIIISYGEQIKEKTSNIPPTEELDSIVRDIKSNKGSYPKLIESITSFKKYGEKLKEFPQGLRKIIEEMNVKVRNIQSETLPDLPKLGEQFKTEANKMNEIYDPNDSSWAYKRLGLIKDIDSFHIEFTKFIARLSYILSQHSRDFNIRKPHIQIKPKKYDFDTRNKLIKILQLEIKEKYPKLSDYLLSMFKYNKYRKIEAHENPIVRMENRIAYFSIKGTNREVEMNLVEINKIHRTYSYFIKALNLVSNYKL